MNYIDTHTKETIENTMCKLLNIEKHTLNDIFKSIYENQDKTPEVWIQDFLIDYISDEICPKIQFYHLTRRLKVSNLNIGNNLYDLMLSDNIVSRFLNNHGVRFGFQDEHLILFHHNKLVNFDEMSEEPCVANTKWRMGYYKSHPDYCFNGFALRDRLVKNQYMYSLESCPEFIEQMLLSINRRDIIRAYEKNSYYYCLEFLVPIDKIIFDDASNLQSEYSKKIYYLSGVFYRLYEYWLYGKRISDNSNLILRLKDEDTMNAEYFVNAEPLLTE